MTFSSEAEPKVEIEVETAKTEDGAPNVVKEEFVDPAATALLSALESEGVTEGEVKLEVGEEIKVKVENESF